ncbi:MAG: Rieske (2Fe-2S) protein [Cyclobacteriaceae bacterium]
MNKREFLKQASAATALAYFGLSLESCSEEELPDPTGGDEILIDLTALPFTTLQNDQGWLLHPDFDILLVNVGGTINAFSSRCTHSGCTRQWSFSEEFTCTCHGSKFDTSGNVVSGPAQGSLTRVSVTREGDMITLG